MEPQVIISIHEYNRLKKVDQEFKNAFDEKRIIMHHRSYFPGHAGYAVNDYRIVNETDVIAGLNEDLRQVRETLVTQEKSYTTARKKDGLVFKQQTCTAQH